MEHDRSLGHFFLSCIARMAENITAFVSVLSAQNVRVPSFDSTLDDHQSWYTFVNKLRINPKTSWLYYFTLT